MRRFSCQLRQLQILAVVLIVLVMTFPAHAQSTPEPLGDVARENREKKSAAAPAQPPKVITNRTISKDPEAITVPATSEHQAQTALSQPLSESSKQAARQRSAEERVAQQWKQKIQLQENTIANLRMRVDKLKASIHFVDPNNYHPYDYYSAYAGVEENRYQARQLERLAQMQQQLDQQRKKLEDMQEAARHAGMHTPVYDP